jgi:Ca2+-binding EF-hand superfamily protein
LIDFGLSSLADHGDFVGVGSILPAQRSCFCNGSTASDFVGTPPYMAPEILRRKAIDFSKADMWSLAVSAIELLTGECPFGKLSDFNDQPEPIYEQILGYLHFSQVNSKLQKISAWQSTSPEAKDFIRWILRDDPQARPSAVRALHHPWVEQTSLDTMRSRVGPDMLRSMADYCYTHPLMRFSLLLLTARMGLSDEDRRVKEAFLTLDQDHDGELTREDLVEAVECDSHWLALEVTVDEMIDAADLDQSGGLSYSEFVQACTYATWNCKGDLPRLTFDSFDRDRDGVVHREDMIALLGSKDLCWVSDLPDSFTLKDWRRCVGIRYDAGFSKSIGNNIRRRGPTQPQCTPSLFDLGWLAPLFNCKMKPVTT